MVFDLLIDEIKANFKDYDGKGQYNLYCSESFYEAMNQAFQKTGFEIAPDAFNIVRNRSIPPNYTGFQFPGVGMIHVIRNLDMGYKIEKYDNV